MAQIIREIRVDVSQPNVFQAIVAKQLDCNSRFLKITLVDFGVKIEVPKTAKVTINANRPDGKSDSFMGVANNDGTITVPLAQWMLEVAGELKCDVSVINTTDNKRLTSTDFYVNVQEAANKSTDISENPDGEIRVITPTQTIDKNSTDDQYPSAKAVYELDNITATASGKAITIDSAEAPLQNLKLYGKTTQDGTLGENILPYPYTTKTIDGVTFTDLGDGRIQVGGTASADITYELLKDATIDGLVVGRTYRVTGCNYSATNINFGMSFSQTSGPTQEFILLNGEEFTAVATSITGLTATLSVLAGQTINTTIHPKLEVASVNLVSVGDSGSFEVGVYVKNLYKNNATSKTVQGITYTVNSDGSVTANGTATATSQLNLGTTRLPKGNYKATGYDGSISGISLYCRASTDTGWFTVVKERNLTYTQDVNVYFLISIGAGVTVTNLTFYPMIRLATETDNTYEPCNKQTVTMPYNLRSVGDIKDEVDFAKGINTEKTCKVVYDGSDDENWVAASNNRVYIIPNNIATPKATNQLANAMCNSFSVITNDAIASTQTNGFSINPQGLLVFKYNELTSSLDNWKTYLKSNPITVICECKTPIETPLTETELNAYRQLYTNKGTTTILSECEDTEITYYINKPNAQAIGSLHEQINKDYFKLQQAIISTGGSTL